MLLIYKGRTQNTAPLQKSCTMYRWNLVNADDIQLNTLYLVFWKLHNFT